MDKIKVTVVDDITNSVMDTVREQFGVKEDSDMDDALYGKFHSDIAKVLKDDAPTVSGADAQESFIKMCEVAGVKPISPVCAVCGQTKQVVLVTENEQVRFAIKCGCGVAVCP